MGTFIDAIQHSLKSFVRDIKVVSIDEKPSTIFDADRSSKYTNCRRTKSEILKKSEFLSLLNIGSVFKESSKIWIAASYQGSYLDPVKLKGLLELQMSKVSIKIKILVYKNFVDDKSVSN